MTEGEVSTKTTIDASLERYKIENFKNTNAKRVPYEEIDYNIYKSSHTMKMAESIIRKSSLDGLSKKIKIIRRNAIKSRSVFTQKRMKMF